MKIVIINKFRCAKSFDSIILLIINIIFQINFKNLILFFNLFINLKMINDIISKLRSYMITKNWSKIEREKKIFIDNDKNEFFELNKNNIYYCVNKIFCCSDFFNRYIFRKFCISIHYHQNWIADRIFMIIKK